MAFPGSPTSDANCLHFAARTVQLTPDVSVGIMLTRCHFNVKVTGYDPERIINQIIEDYGVDKIMEIIKAG